MPIFDYDDSESVKEVKNQFDSRYCINLLLTPKYHEFDLKDRENKVVVEVKRRGLEHDTLNSTIMGYNKLIKAKQYIKRGYTVYFAFLFTDGLYYYKYDGRDYPKRQWARTDRGKTELKDYFFIHVDDLKPWNETIYEF
jgi:hypothetical protein